MIEAKGPKISLRIEKFFVWIETYGSSIALYLLVGMIIVGIWEMLPIPGPGLASNFLFAGWVGLGFIFFSALHGLLWWILTRKFITLPRAVKYWLSLAIRLVRPLHMSTGMLGLGFSILHGLSYLSLGTGWTIALLSGLAALVTLIILALDGIGLMVSPFLSRKVHRWVAFFFLITVLVHLIVPFL